MKSLLVFTGIWHSDFKTHMENNTTEKRIKMRRFDSIYFKAIIINTVFY